MVFKKKVQSRVLRFLLRWMESEPRDFVDEQTIKELTELTKTFQFDGWDVFTEEIVSILQKKIEPLLLRTETDLLPPALDVPAETILPLPGTNVSKLLLDLDETTFAQQLTLFDARLYQRIQNREFVDRVRNRNPHHNPNLDRFIADIDGLSSWVSSVILSEQSLESRVEVYCKVVRIAFACFRLHNFKGMMKLVSGLEIAAVHRLKHTKEAAPNEIKGMLEEMNKVLDHRMSYSTYRNLVSTLKPPAIPHPVVPLSALCFVEDGGVSSDRINLRKYKWVCEEIKEFQRFQGMVSFPFEEDPIILGCFENLDKVDEEKLYFLSLQREPRQKKSSSFTTFQGEK